MWKLNSIEAENQFKTKYFLNIWKSKQKSPEKNAFGGFHVRSDSARPLLAGSVPSSTKKKLLHIYFMNQLHEHEIGSEVFPHHPSESLAQVGENLHWLTWLI